MKFLPALLVVLLLVSCRQSGDKSAVPEDPQTALVTFSGPAAPDFDLPSLEGDPVRLSSLRSRIVVLNFWATWCVPCLKEMPELNKVHKRLEANGVTVIGVSLDTEPAEVVAHFANRLDVGYPIVIADSLLAETYGQLTDLTTTLYLRQRNPNASAVQRAFPGDAGFGALAALPATMVIDQQGNIAAHMVGLLAMEDLEATIIRLQSGPEG